MKILIRDKNQSRYLNDRDKWVNDIAKARDFGSGAAAIMHAAKIGLDGGTVLFCVFPNPKYNMEIPLEAEAPTKGEMTRNGRSGRTLKPAAP